MTWIDSANHLNRAKGYRLAVTHFVFPDITVLCNFAVVHHLDLLEKVLLGRGRWTEVVEFEARQSSRWFPDLPGLPSAGWLGMPIELTGGEHIRAVERIRRVVFGGSGDRSTDHLGEAQTYDLIRTVPYFADSWWVSDDRESVRYARHQGLTTLETVDLVRMSVEQGGVTAEAGFALLQEMVACGRHLRLPVSPNELMG